MRTALKQKEQSNWFSNWVVVRKLRESIDFSLPLEAWNNSKHVIYSILLASFFINILSLAFPMALLQVYDRIIPNVAMNTLVLLVAGVCVALLFEAILKMMRSYVSNWADGRFEHVTGCRAYKRLLNSSLQAFEDEGSAVHLKRLNSLSRLREFYSGQVLISIADMPYIVLLLLIIAYIGTWVVFIPIVMLVVFLTSAVMHSSTLEKVLHIRLEHDDRRMNFIIETLGNIHTVKSIAMEAQMLRRYERLQKMSSVYDYEVSENGSVSMVLGQTLSQLTIILVAICGAVLVVKGHLTMGGLAACTLLSGRCLQPVNTLVGVWTRLQTVKIATENIKEMLDFPQESTKGLPDVPTIAGNVELKNLSFRYTDESSYLFENVNVSIKQGEVVGIQGEGLTGKSTLAWLLTGLMPPTRGEVLLDGLNMHDFNLESVRKQIAYLPQKAVIFNGTIMENITVFEVKKYYQQAKVIAGVLGLADIIERLPEGYETMIGNQAIDALPRGVTQRIAIARALIYNPKIVIFDEANIAIDMQGDEAIRHALERIVGRCTLIIISYRPSMLKLANQVYLIEGKQLRLKQ